MATSEPVMRRGGTSRRSQNGGRQPERLALDAAEEGIAHRIPESPMPRREKAPRRRASLSIKLRRWLLLLRSNPEKLFKCAVGTFATALGLSYIVAVLLHRSLDSSTSSQTPSPLQTTASHVKQKRHAVFPKQNTERILSESTFQVLFEHTTLGPPMDIPEVLEESELEDLNYYDFGGLEFRLLLDDSSARAMMRDFQDLETDFRPPDAERDDDMELYYAFDDDFLRDVGSRGESVHRGEDGFRCRRVAEHKLNFPNCNSFHEAPMIEMNAKYLSAGAYRQVLVMDKPLLNETEKVIIKDISYDYDFKHDHFEYVRMDAIVAERLTASPRIYDIYGLCGLGILSEYFPHGDIEDDVLEDGGYSSQKDLHDGYHLRPQNNFTGFEKLEMALEMAEAVADLHGNPGGVIVHQDIQLSQFLWSADESMLKLNDFNRAEFMLFDEEAQRYCPYREGPGNGNWRSPEEYFDALLTEQVDVWSLGNNIYGLLTGLCPLYDEEDDSKMQKRIKKGKTAYIDPRYKRRSPSEGKLVEVIEKSFAFKAEDRPSIFEIVTLLRAAVKEVKANKQEANPPSPMPSSPAAENKVKTASS